MTYSPKVNVLLVDDQPSNLLALESVLESLGQNLIRAASGEEALRYLLTNDAAVILLDVHMPGMDGFETATLIRSRERSKTTPIIFLTAYSTHDEHVFRGYALGAVDYIFKPLVPEVLRSKVTVFVDLYRATEQVRAQARELARSNVELERFAYVASHDLQEPLRMVASYAELLAQRYRGRLDADADEFIGFMVEGVLRMKQLIHDLLAYSRVSTEDRVVRPTSCEELLARALDDLRGAVAESGAVVTHGPLPTVAVDERQMRQVFQNLVGNAIKFRSKERPRIHVTAERRSCAAGGSEWVLAFADDGIGIDPAYFERIFVIFQRLHTREEYAGTGVGLAICKRVIERHGGRIWVESHPGRGSTFRFVLPGLDECAGETADESRVSREPVADAGGVSAAVG